MNENTKSEKELVVLLHGILDSGMKMKAMERYLRRQGYDTINLSYPSTRLSIEELADYAHKKLSAQTAFNNAVRVHFVTHSMGGLLTRYFIHKYRPAHLGRVVMAGTPNRGSQFADFLDDNPALRPLFERICGPAGRELKTGHEHDPAMVVDYEVGVIAGSQSINPLADFILPAPHDGTVAAEHTRLDGMADHIIVPANHPFMMAFACVQQQTLHFLRHGRFDHS